jgi:MFS family permease
MDPFLQKFFPAVYHRKNSGSQNNYCKYDNQGLAAFTSSLYVAGLIASLAASPVTRNYGRKVSIVCGGISFLVGATLNAAAVNLAMLLLGRIMLGVGIGFGNQVINYVIFVNYQGQEIIYAWSLYGNWASHTFEIIFQLPLSTAINIHTDNENYVNSLNMLHFRLYHCTCLRWHQHT